MINGSRVEPRVAFLKPLSAAISIGSGGPFGPAHLLLTDVLQSIHTDSAQRSQRLYPVGDNAARLIGVVTRSTLQELLPTSHSHDSRQLSEIVQAHPVVAYPDEPLRVVVDRMAATGLTRLPVVTRNSAGTLLGIVSLRDLLQARVRNLEAEQRRERLLPGRLAFPRRFASRPKLQQGEHATT